MEWLGLLGGIILVDLVLSGDNALVIGATASGLPRKQRWLAIVAGGGGAIVLRILFTVIAAFLLQLPLLQAIGGVLLLFIAIKLLNERREKMRPTRSETGEWEHSSKKAFVPALLTILVADVTMSLDNVLSVGALADGHFALLATGLLLSIVLLLVGSALISELIVKLPGLMDVASLVLAWTGAHMLLDDIHLGPVLDHLPWTEFAVPAAALAIVVIADIFIWRRDLRLAQQKA